MSNYNKKKVDFKAFKAKVEIKKVLYSKDDWGIFSCIPISSDEPTKTNSYGSYSVKGTVPYDLQEGREYTVYIGNETYNPQYQSYTYDIKEVEMEKLSEPEQQFSLIKTLVAENIYKQLHELYKDQNIFELIDKGKVDLSKIKGFKEVSLDKLKTKLATYKDLGQLQILLAPLGVGLNSIKKISDHFEGSELAYRVLSKSLYHLCEVRGYGFKKVDEIVLKTEVELNDTFRIKYCLAYIIEEESNDGHSWIYKSDLLTKAIEYLKIESSYIEDIFNQSEFNKSKSYQPSDIIIMNDIASTYSLYYDELSTLRNLDRIHGNYTPVKMDDINEYIREAEDELGITYTDEQRETIKECLDSGVFILNGKSGTGKTTSVKAITKILEMSGITYHGAVLSGKGSMVMTSKGIQSSTIHRLLGYNGSGFTFNEDTPLPYQCIIVDESSMVNSSLFSSLLKAVPSGGKVILVGDSGQIGSIGAGCVFEDLLNSSRYPRRELQQIHRQAQDSGVIEVAHKIRNGKQITNYNEQLTKKYGKNGDISVITRNKPKKDSVEIDEWMSEEDIKELQNPIYKLAKQIIVKQIEKIKQSSDEVQGILDFQVLCPTKSNGALSVDSINKFIQSIYNQSDVSLKIGNKEFKEHSKVIVNGNTYNIPAYETLSDYEIGNPIKPTEEDYENDEEGNVVIPKFIPFNLYNGSIGTIEWIDTEQEEVLVKFEGYKGYIALDKEGLLSLDLAYAISIHKSQGSGFPNVLVMFDYSAFKLLSKQIVYTAITRTSDKCVLLCENNALIKAISNDESGKRKSFMKLFLEQLEGENK